MRSRSYERLPPARFAVLLIGFWMAWAGGRPLGTSSSAVAQSLSLTTRTVYHGYQLQIDPLDADAQRNLHQFYVSIDGRASRVGPSGQFDVVTSLRYDTDFGNGFQADTPFGAGVRTLQQVDDIDVLLLYIDWRNVGGRSLDIRLGRQTQIDDLDWYVLDGVKLQARFWEQGENRVEAELYAGAPVRYDALFSSTDALVGDGTEVYDGSGLLGGVGVGGRVFVQLFRDLTLSFSARNELVFRDDVLEGFGEAVCVEPCRATLLDTTLSPIGTPIEGSEAARSAAANASAGSTGLQESLLGGSIGYQLRPLRLNLQGSFAYNVLTDHLDRVRFAVGYDPATHLHLGAEYLRIRPRFLGDSIFNWFNIFSYDRVQAEGNWSILDQKLTFVANYFMQFYRGDEELADENEREDVIFGPGGGITWRDKNYGVAVHVEAGTNPVGVSPFGGDYFVASMSGDVSVFQNIWVADGQVSVTAVRDDWGSPNSVSLLDGQVRRTWNLSLGSRFQLASWVRARVQALYNIDPVFEGNYRIYSELVMVYR